MAGNFEGDFISETVLAVIMQIRKGVNKVNEHFVLNGLEVKAEIPDNILFEMGIGGLIAGEDAIQFKIRISK